MAKTQTSISPGGEEPTTAKLGIRARNEALRYILEKYKEEFEKVHQQNRINLGLPRHSQGVSPEALKAQLQKTLDKAEELRRRIEQAEAA